MRIAKDSCAIKFDFFGRPAILLVVPEKDNTLFEIDEEEAFNNGEALCQILEGNAYEYFLPDSDLELSSNNGVVIQSRQQKNRGRIVPNVFVGTLALTVSSSIDPSKLVKVSIEVLATKFNIEPDQSYRINYRKMLEDVTSKCTDLLLQSGSPVSHNFETDYSTEYRTLYQRFCFVRSVIDSRAFNEAVSRIIAFPRTTWREERDQVDIRSIKRFRSGELRQLVSGRNRLPLPLEHPLQKSGITSVPQRINTTSKTDTVDTPENRFVKHALEQFQNFIEKCILTFPNKSREQMEAKQLNATLDNYLSSGFFREITRPASLNLNSPVLQRKSGYREILKAWLLFDLAAKLIWRGGEDVYEGGKRDIAVLYEYWLFFALYDLFEKKFGLSEVEDKRGRLDNLFALDKNGVNLILKAGNYVALSGIHDFGSRKLHIKFSYNRSFKGGRIFSVNKGGGSWTTTLRPDYTISFWPSELSDEEAEIQEEIVHIHFDAKYKVTQFEVSESDETELLDEEEKNERLGIYKNADLLKMHAYKDAIRRTGGAYVLYPGTEQKEYNGFHELLPGLGAFAVNPSEEKKGLKNISEFIDRVVENLLDRSSQRERLSSHSYRIHENEKSNSLREFFPEKINGQKIVPDETTVIIGYYKSREHLEWILTSKLYNFRTGTRKGSIEMTPENIGARFLILHGDGSFISSKIFSLSNAGPRIFSGVDLANEGYPSAKGDLYLVFNIDTQKDREFRDVKFDLTKIKGFAESKLKYGPVTCTLTQLFDSKVE